MDSWELSSWNASCAGLRGATLRLESNDLMADAAKSPVLAAAINQVMTGIITAATEIKALRDAENESALSHSGVDDVQKIQDPV